MGFWTGAEDLEAPPFRLVDVDGEGRNRTDYEGRFLLVDFMGTWCGPCQRSVGDIRALDAQYPRLDVLSISSTDSAPQLRDFRAQYGVTWPMAVDTDDVVGGFASATGTSSWLWPSYALLDPDGRIVFWSRGETLPATLAAAMEDATGERAPAGADVLVPATAALLLGFTLPLSPFLLRTTLSAEPVVSRRLRIAAAFAVVLYAGLAWLIVEAGRPLSGRIQNVAGIAALGGLVGLWLWRSKGTDGVQVKGHGLTRDGWRWQASLHGNLLYAGAPVVLAVLLAAFKRTIPTESLVLVATLGIGLATGLALLSLPSVRSRMREQGDGAALLAAAGTLVAAAWIAWAWLQ